MDIWVRQAAAMSACPTVTPTSGTAVAELDGDGPEAINSAIKDGFNANCDRMVETIDSKIRLTSGWIGKTALDPRILNVVSCMLRYEFIPPKLP